MFELKLLEQKEELDAACQSHNEVVAHTFAFRELAQSRGLAMVSQMESRFKRDYSRALSDLLRLRRLRASTPVAENEKMKNEPNPRTEHQPSITNRRSPTPNHLSHLHQKATFQRQRVASSIVISLKMNR